MHPRLPYFPLGGNCKSDYGKFDSGQSVLLNCTQDFEDIPIDYVNTVILLEDSQFPLIFEMKIPLGKEKESLRSHEE